MMDIAHVKVRNNAEYSLLLLNLYLIFRHFRRRLHYLYVYFGSSDSQSATGRKIDFFSGMQNPRFFLRSKSRGVKSIIRKARELHSGIDKIPVPSESACLFRMDAGLSHQTLSHSP